MKEILTDLVNSIGGLGFTVIRVTGTDKETTFESFTEDKSIILKAKAKTVDSELEGTFGLNNLPLLAGLIALPNFKSDDASVKVTKAKKDGKTPEEIVFKAGSKGSVASYRLMHEAAIPKQPVFKTPKWNATLANPEKSNLAEFSTCAAIYKDIEKSFLVKAKDGVLMFQLGQESAANHKASVLISTECDGDFNASWTWPSEKVTGILRLADKNNCTINFSEAGAMQIDIETEFNEYSFILPGHN